MTWMLTAHRRRFNLAAPTPSMVGIDDIAHHLAQLNRFTGATVRPCSVAEHSLFVAEILAHEHPGCPPIALRAGLLHDAREAYTNDPSSPWKQVLGEAYELAEWPIERAVRQHFGIEQAAIDWRAAIKHADLVALATERRDLMPYDDEPWAVLRGIEPVDWIWLRDRDGMDWDDWRLAFLARHEEIAAAIEAWHGATR
jgi:hypothetical protein